MSTIDKDAAVAEIREMMHDNYAGPPGTIEAACLFWAKATCIVLEGRGLRAIVQAGSAGWPRIDEADDDGEVNTHFSYVWEPDSPSSIAAVKAYRMPEMHVWAAMPDTQTIIDVTSGFQPGQCLTTLGMDWPGTKPPEYIWSTPEGMYGKCFYKADITAIGLAFEMYRNSEWGERK
tara:strand:+ start:1490 stop:2017 length:528 start_codon:yes stop_codon:yes gene_type:complete